MTEQQKADNAAERAGNAADKADNVAERVKLDVTRQQARRSLKANMMGWIGVLLVVAVLIYWQDQRDQARQREICGLMTLLDSQYIEHPPTTDTGVAVAKAIHGYRQSLGCR